jgi:DNA primase large subunit
MFVLTNFLSNVGWDHDKIEEFLKEWNKKNPEPLREVYLVGHMRYSKRQKKKVMPPNCDNKGYYQDMHLCSPDALCRKVKNPVNYSIRKTYYLRHNQDSRKKGQKEANKAKPSAAKEENKAAEKKPVDEKER